MKAAKNAGNRILESTNQNRINNQGAQQQTGASINQGKNQELTEEELVEFIILNLLEFNHDDQLKITSC